MTTMGRRGFLAGLGALASLGAVRPEPLVFRRARFEELGKHVVMTARFPELLRVRDREAMAGLESGFETKLVFDMAVYEHGTDNMIARHHRVVKVVFHYMKKEYLLTVTMDGKTVVRRWLPTRQAAVEAAVTFRRVPVVRTAGLARGEDGPFYYVTIVGQRNPIDEAFAEPGLAPGAGRAQGRDTRWFNSFVNFLAGDLPRAEASLRVRTQPFYLVTK